MILGEIIVHIVGLPLHVKAFTIPDNGDFVILLNSNLTYETQQLAYVHELEHIYGGDLH